MDAQLEKPLAAMFPLPFRVLFLVGLGILGWATNLHGLERLGVDGPGILELQDRSYLPLRSGSPSRNKQPSAHAFYAPLYRLFVIYSTWCFGAWLLYRVQTRSTVALVDVFAYIPGVCMLCILTILLCTMDIVQKRERDSFLLSAERCCFPASDGPIHFSDVIFADILTSYAKVLGDVWLSFWMLLPGGSLLSIPQYEGWYQWVLPCLMSIPYAIRLRQCLIEYWSPSNTSRRPLLNAIKYASSFPVIFLSAAQRLVESELVGVSAEHKAWHGEHPLFRLWLVAVVVNSLYSFWWDVTNDWGLELLNLRHTESRAVVFPLQQTVTADRTPSHLRSSRGLSFRRTNRHSPPYPYGLRPILLYPLPVYPLIVFLNLVLRMTWSIKLSSHLHLQSEGSVVIFFLEVAEVLRRWMWVFLRIEWEVVRKGRDKERPTDTTDELELLDAHKVLDVE
ncbi:EXS-domain-containing protein [Pisolithus croceorrhizus]|nr:EXS-domain-containing protein [Pisolithus croceorrhizus]KAI6135714.1 EXS-domain-containing protein [Pisolithus croceorrhizus]